MVESYILEVNHLCAPNKKIAQFSTIVSYR